MQEDFTVFRIPEMEEVANDSSVVYEELTAIAEEIEGCRKRMLMR